MSNKDELEIEALVDNLPKVLEFVDEKLDATDCPIEVKLQVDIAVEEIFVNIASYAYNPKTGPAIIEVEVIDEPLSVELTFIDKGVQYDPLAKEDPDVTLSAEERGIGGLGIFMVKQSMDNVVYEYKNGKNILTIKKNF
ncbi:MAG: ATP-binding protein [Lachnospiraceae bacterium]|nr:ATP-binding protein [Lachnospiraceae bacterium]